jgi:hypothetical protein
LFAETKSTSASASEPKSFKILVIILLSKILDSFHQYRSNSIVNDFKEKLFSLEKSN